MGNVACKVRIHPTKEHEKFLVSNIGACRFVWDMLVDLQKSRHGATGEILSEFDCNKHITAWSEWFRQCTAAQARRRNARGGHTGVLETLGTSPSDEAHNSAQGVNALH